jgi:hypothetical protein
MVGWDASPGVEHGSKRKGDIMYGPNCHNCIFSVCDPELWLKLVWLGEPLVPRCANHPDWPGQLHDVTGIPCENYRRKPDPPRGENVRMIPLSEGGYAYVDAADYERFNRWNWNMAGGGYAARVENGTTVLMHRLIMKPPKGMVVDHADGNRCNNCRSNLRVCTRKENQRNIRKQRGARSPFKGVYYDMRRGKIFAQYYFEGRAQWLGYFETGLDAARAHDHAVVQTFGEFARVNFPREWPPERRAEVYASRPKTKKKAGRRNAGS